MDLSSIMATRRAEQVRLEQLKATQGNCPLCGNPQGQWAYQAGVVHCSSGHFFVGTGVPAKVTGLSDCPDCGACVVQVRVWAAATLTITDRCSNGHLLGEYHFGSQGAFQKALPRGARASPYRLRAGDN